MDLAKLQQQKQFAIRQKITMMVNRYVVTTLDPAGTEGEQVAFVEQKRMAFREEVTFYSDETKREQLLRFKARKVIDLGSGYDVMTPDGTSIGLFRKNFGASLLRSTWHVEQPGAPAITGQERSMVVALLRRIWDVIPFTDIVPFAWPYHFDFGSPAGPVMSVEKKFGIRDRYVLTVHADALDRRLAIAMAVALDALQSR
ncbi:MAG: hypothetical protein L0Y54_12960 [Sporichthyaceae bacterium]|nr:hypothetical protein [Sporichthyaceae bacterium]